MNLREYKTTLRSLTDDGLEAELTERIAEWKAVRRRTSLVGGARSRELDAADDILQAAWSEVLRRQPVGEAGYQAGKAIYRRCDEAAGKREMAKR